MLEVLFAQNVTLNQQEMSFSVRKLGSFQILSLVLKMEEGVGLWQATNSMLLFTRPHQQDYS